MCLRFVITCWYFEYLGPRKGALSCFAVITKDKRNWRFPENKASTAPGALREIPDYHISGNNTKTVGSASDCYCFFFFFFFSKPPKWTRHVPNPVIKPELWLMSSLSNTMWLKTLVTQNVTTCEVSNGPANTRLVLKIARPAHIF